MDLTGRTFNNLKVIKDSQSRSVKAQCLLCESVKDYNKRVLMEGKRKSCGCEGEMIIFKDRTGGNTQ